MRKLLLIIAAALLLTGAVWGTEEELTTVFAEYPNAVGFFGSSDAGAGLSYQRWFGRLGFSVMAGIVYYPDDFYFSRSLDYSVYPELQFSLYAQDLTSWLSGMVYLFAGGFHGGYISQTWDWDETRMDYLKEVGSFVPYLGLSAGIGIETVLFRHFSGSLEIGYAPIWSYNPYRFWVPFMVQGAFRFRF